MVQIYTKYLVGSSQKKPYFCHSEMEKWIFRAKKMKTSFRKLIGHSNIHTYAKYEIIWENYSLKLALTSVIWLESHESSYSIAHFEKTFLTYLPYFKFVVLYGY